MIHHIVSRHMLNTYAAWARPSGHERSREMARWSMQGKDILATFPHVQHCKQRSQLLRNTFKFAGQSKGWMIH